MENKTYIQDLYEKGTTAYWAIADYTQEQIDTMLEAMAKTVFHHSDELGEMVYNEVGMGDPQMTSNLMKMFPLCHWNYLKDKNAFGLLSDDKETMIQTYGKAMGVVCCLTPSTTHISNGFELVMKAVKSGNAIILAPHPRAWKSSKRLAEIFQEAIKETGGPDNLVQSIENPTVELSAECMSTCDVVVGTGGAEMVKAAYSSGTPAFGVGQGNVPVVISAAYPAEELHQVIPMIVYDRSAGGGNSCTCPQHILIPRSRQDEIMNIFKASGAFVIEDEAIIDNIREVVFPGGGTRINRDIVGHSATAIANAYGIEVPEGTQIIMLKVKDGSRGSEDVLFQEIMNPTLRFQFYDDYKDAIEIMRDCLFNMGAGHSAQIWSYDQNEIDLAAKRLPVVRVLVRQIGAGVANLTLQNGLSPSTSVGCGTWGGNGFSDNVSYRTLQNHTMVIYPISEGHIPTYEEVFGN